LSIAVATRIGALPCWDKWSSALGICVALSARECPDCGRRIREPFEETVTGREVCADCAQALVLGPSVGAITGNVGSGFGVWAMLMRKIRRSDR
jgi:hypothetical protein